LGISSLLEIKESMAWGSTPRGGIANTYAVRSVSRPPQGPAERDRSELLVVTTRGYDSAVSVDWARSICLAGGLEA
jgi:hypothetical protein